jgi:hypothetical protein
MTGEQFSCRIEPGSLANAEILYGFDLAVFYEKLLCRAKA